MTRNGTILVIDDEEIMREILEALLTREGYQVRLAAHAAEGLELARTMPFDAAPWVGMPLSAETPAPVKTTTRRGRNLRIASTA